jgi:serine/threonine protein kinase
VTPKGDPILIDLGAARFFDETMPKDEIVISIPYSSNLIMSGEPINAQADIYSMGVSLIHMLTGFPSWAEDSREEYEFVTEPAATNRLSSRPSEHEIRSYLYRSLGDWRVRFVRDVLTKTLFQNEACYSNIRDFRNDLANCLTKAKSQ